MSLNVKSGVIRKVLEEGFVRSSKSQFSLLEFGQNSEMSLSLIKERFSKYVALKHYIPS